MSSVTLIGIGSAGIATVNQLTETNIYKLKTIAVDTDTQRLANAKADVKIQAGKTLCNGNGTGFNPELGEQALIEAKDALIAELNGSKLVIISTGLGGGTGSGSVAPIMQIVKDLGILSYTLVTTPFGYENLDGSTREFNTQYAIDSIQKINTAYEIIDGQKIENYLNGEINMFDLFAVPRLELLNKIKALTSLVVEHGEINIDFADISRVLNIGGRSFINSISGDSIHQITQSVLVPKFSHNTDLSGVTGYLANIAAKNVSKLDVLAVNSKIKTLANSQTQNKVGFSQNDSDQKTLTVVLTGIGSSHQVYTPVNYQKEFEVLKETQKNGINILNSSKFVF